MISLLVFSFVVFAIAYGVGHSGLSFYPRVAIVALGRTYRWLALPARFTISLLECPFCLSFWLGLGAFLLHLTPPVLTSWWAAAFFSATTSLLLAKVVGLLDPES